MNWTTSKINNGGVLVARILTTAFAAGAIAMTMLTPRDAEALPAYAKKESKPCSFCHVNAKGGGPKTPAGEYYKAHSHTLVGFKEGGAAPKPSPKPAVKPTPKPKASPKAKTTGKPKAKPSPSPTPKKG